MAKANYLGKYLKDAGMKLETPQSEPLNERQVQNDAGGFVFEVDPMTQLDRFLVLGTQGGTYYVGEQKLTAEAASMIKGLLDSDGLAVVSRIVEISESGRAHRNDQALFALALATKAKSVEVRTAAYNALPKVARIGTHLFQFLSFTQDTGWSAGKRRAVSNWYTQKESDKLGYQMVKYRQRVGWSHRDALLLAHVKPTSPEYQALFSWAAQNKYVGDNVDLPDIVHGFEAVQHATKAEEVIKLVETYRLPHEAIPTTFKNDPDVQMALLENMPLMAMVRNLGNMGKSGLLIPNSDAEALVVGRLADQDRITKSRMHPLHFLAAVVTYGQGHSARGDGVWDPAAGVKNALDDAFYASFGNVVSTFKRFMFGLDVSSSMRFGDVSGIYGMTPCMAQAALALVNARVEPRNFFLAFSDVPQPIDITNRDRLTDAMKKTQDSMFGGTDVAIPMKYAEKHKIAVDAFVVLSDMQTWAGDVHPQRALERYRQATGIPAKLVAGCMTSNCYSVVDPQDSSSLNVVGFDANTPRVIGEFVAG